MRTAAELDAGPAIEFSMAECAGLSTLSFPGLGGWLRESELVPLVRDWVSRIAWGVSDSARFPMRYRQSGFVEGDPRRIDDDGGRLIVVYVESNFISNWH